jgi:hypothetical protein
MSVFIFANTFPPLRPVARSYDMGVFPLTDESEFPGGGVRFLHGTTSAGHQLNLSFVGLTETQVGYIRQHYRLNEGGYKAFALSPEVWAGHSSMIDLVPATTKWKYAAPYEEEHMIGGYYNATVSLVSVISL